MSSIGSGYIGYIGYCGYREYHMSRGAGPSFFRYPIPDIPALDTRYTRIQFRYSIRAAYRRFHILKEELAERRVNLGR